MTAEPASQCHSPAHTAAEPCTDALDLEDVRLFVFLSLPSANSLTVKRDKLASPKAESLFILKTSNEEQQLGSPILPPTPCCASTALCTTGPNHGCSGFFVSQTHFKHLAEPLNTEVSCSFLDDASQADGSIDV